MFALYGAEARDEPYIGRTPNLRVRLEKLLQPSARSIHGDCNWPVGFGELRGDLLVRNSNRCWRNLRSWRRFTARECWSACTSRSPAFVRFLGGNPYPRITVTHRPSQREADWSYGPFASRAAAERFAEEALKLFLLRRCTDDLEPDPSHPGCVYSEMKMCLAPCYKGCSDERYAEEADAVERFLATRGENRLVVLRGERDAASANLEFENAAALHSQVQRVESVRSLAPELVRPLSQLRAVILQASAQSGRDSCFCVLEWEIARSGWFLDTRDANTERAVGLQFPFRASDGNRACTRNAWPFARVPMGLTSRGKSCKDGSRCSRITNGGCAGGTDARRQSSVRYGSARPSGSAQALVLPAGSAALRGDLLS